MNKRLQTFLECTLAIVNFWIKQFKPLHDFFSDGFYVIFCVGLTFLLNQCQNVGLHGIALILFTIYQIQIKAIINIQFKLHLFCLPCLISVNNNENECDQQVLVSILISSEFSLHLYQMTNNFSQLTVEHKSLSMHKKHTIFWSTKHYFSLRHSSATLCRPSDHHRIQTTSSALQNHHTWSQLLCNFLTIKQHSNFSPCSRLSECSTASPLHHSHHTFPSLPSAQELLLRAEPRSTLYLAMRTAMSWKVCWGMRATKSLWVE